MKPHSYPIFIDFEASSLGDLSYPIEVAWNVPNGGVKSFLINPQFVPDWTDWSMEAERDAHKIPRDYLLVDGEDPCKVAAIMNEELQGEILYSDAPLFDNFWVNRLFKAADQQPQFKIESALTLVYERIAHKLSLDASQITLNDLEARYQMLRTQAWNRLKIPAHRASNDVKCLMEVYNLSGTQMV